MQVCYYRLPEQELMPFQSMLLPVVWLSLQNLADGQTLTLGKNGATKWYSHHGTPANEKISLTNTSGTASDAIAITATAGGFSIDAVQASDITLASAGDADDLTIAVTGANDASLLLSSAGTGTDAVSIDATAGSMVIAPSLADGQTLKLGKNGATEMVFTPHGTPANEKISLTNTSGTASDAIAITATAGGFSIDAVQASDITLASAGDADDLTMQLQVLTMQVCYYRLPEQGMMRCNYC